MKTLGFIILMAAPSASDIDVENNSFGVGFYSTIEECNQAIGWMDEHKLSLQRHLWCETM